MSSLSKLKNKISAFDTDRSNVFERQVKIRLKEQESCYAKQLETKQLNVVSKQVAQLKRKVGYDN